MKIKKEIIFIFFAVLLVGFISAENFAYNYITSNGGGTTTTITFSGNLTNFTDLSDTPNSYTGQGSKCLRVNAGETAVEFFACAGGGDFSFINFQSSFNLNASTYPFSTFNSTYNLWAYNQTGLFNYNQSSIYSYNHTSTIYANPNQSWLSTYNSTYNLWAYNQSSSVVSNMSWNQSYADLRYAGIIWNYNQTGLFNYNQTYSGSTYNSTYNLWAYNQTGLFNYNQTYSGSTYNATYNLWAYNQTVLSAGNTSWNQSYANTLYANITWNYNQTIFYYSDGVYISKNTTNGFNFNSSMLDTIYYNSTASAVVRGTPQGTSTNINMYDHITYNITEVALADAMDYRINFTGVTNFNRLIIRYRNSGGGHIIKIQFWSYTLGAWEDYGEFQDVITFSVKEIGVYDSVNHISGGIVQLRFIILGSGNTNHKHEFDWVTISQGLATSSGSEVDPKSFHFNTSINNPENNITGLWFNGKFNWTTLNNWLYFDGSTLSYNETKLNNTIDLRATGGNSSWNQSYADTRYSLNTTGSIQTLLNLTGIYAPLLNNSYLNNNTFNYNQSSATGWNKVGTNVFLSTITDKVGIGTAIPSEILTVNNTLGIGKADITYGSLSVFGHSDGTSGVFNLYNGGNFDHFGADYWQLRGYTASGDFYISRNSTQEGLFRIRGTDGYTTITNGINISGMFYVNSSNVGIGTATPTYALQINNKFQSLNVSDFMYANSTRLGLGTVKPTDTLNVVGSMNVTLNSTMGAIKMETMQIYFDGTKGVIKVT